MPAASSTWQIQRDTCMFKHTGISECCKQRKSVWSQKRYGILGSQDSVSQQRSEKQREAQSRSNMREQCSPRLKRKRRKKFSTYIFRQVLKQNYYWKAQKRKPKKTEKGGNTTVSTEGKVSPEWPQSTHKVKSAPWQSSLRWLEEEAAAVSQDTPTEKEGYWLNTP